MKQIIKSKTLKKEFQRLDQIEAEIFQNASRNQIHKLQQLSKKQESQRQRQFRKQNIKKKNESQKISHIDNNHIWLNLANLININDNIDLNDIEQRRQDRIHKRAEMNACQKIDKSDQKADPNNRKLGMKDKKIPWKLMKELHQQQVLQNQIRLQKIRQHKIKNILKQ